MSRKKNELEAINNVHSTETDRTPIEIALQIDENGMTTLKNLYNFLELSPSQYSRWCKKNVIDNPFAIENIDYIMTRLDVDSAVKGQTKIEYKITSDFAKQLSMTVKNEKGQQARQYFIACEQGLKIASKKLQENNSDIKLVDFISQMTSTLSSIDRRLSKIEEEQNKRSLPEINYSRWKTRIFDKLYALMDYMNQHLENEYKLNNIINLVIKETNECYDIDINDYQKMYKMEFGIEKNENLYVLDVINYYPDVRSMFVASLDSILDNLGIIVPKHKINTVLDDLIRERQEKLNA